MSAWLGYMHGFMISEPANLIACNIIILEENIAVLLANITFIFSLLRTVRIQFPFVPIILRT